MPLERVKGKYRWEINNLTRDKLLEPYFETATDQIHLRLGDNNSKWLVYLRTSDKNEITYLSIFLRKSSIDVDNVDVKFGLTLCNSHSRFEHPSYSFVTSWGYSYFVSLENLFHQSYKCVDKNGSMKLHFEIELSTPKPPLVPRIMNFASYLKNPDYFDFTIESSEEDEFKVHRFLLAECSPFFKALFDVDMQERKNKKVVFEDINSITLKEVLKFAYTGESSIDGIKMTTDVLYAAEKFVMTDLKAFCISKLMDKIAKQNALEIFVTADMFRDEFLEMSCLNFILRHYDEMKISDEWIALHPSLFKKITDRFAEDARIETVVFSTKL